MSDVAEVKEAIELYEAAEFKSEVSWPQPPIVAAARRWVRAVETGERVMWCETHVQVAWLPDPDGYCRVGWEDGDHENCSIVPRLVAAVGVEKETEDVSILRYAKPTGGHRCARNVTLCF